MRFGPLSYIVCVVLVGCASGPESVMPVTVTREAPDVVLVWVGQGEAERMEGGRWVRAPEFDYEFSVEQRRYADRWESIKSLRRRHPAYDGSAGPREQHMYFLARYEAGEGDAVRVKLETSLGAGQGVTDRAFRQATLTLKPAGLSRFAPFDTYRITQRYGYAQGELEEVVELVDHEDGREVPWVRNHESARLFGAQRFEAAPTVMRGP